MPESGTANLPIAEWLRDEIKVEAAQRKMSMKNLVLDLWEQRSTAEESTPKTLRGSDMISVAGLNGSQRQLVANLIAMQRDGRSPRLPGVEAALQNYRPEARDEDIGRKDRRHRRKKA